MPFRRCPKCGHRYQPAWSPSPLKYESEVDPIGALDWVCPRELCGHIPE